ncbi:MAG: hypothetical protein F6K28_52445 [Microcoleus sp. SIO2G3]|nr:hypothetical protein [Microcoleus sp. SIO2G3]
MKKRAFAFYIPARLLICISAETEIEAWLEIKRRATQPSQFSAVPYGSEDWFTCDADYSRAELFGKQLPDDDSDRQGGDRNG